MSGKYRVLFFTRGVTPTAEQTVEARQYGPHVFFRNVTHFDPDGSLEDCEAVAGCMPPAYSDTYPLAVSYVDWLNGELPPKPLKVVPVADDRSIALDFPKGRSRLKGPVIGAGPASGLTGDALGFELPPPPPVDGNGSAPPPPPEWTPQG